MYEPEIRVGPDVDPRVSVQSVPMSRGLHIPVVLGVGVVVGAGAIAVAWGQGQSRGPAPTASVRPQSSQLRDGSAAVERVHGYRVEFRLTPNSATVPNRVSVTLRRHGIRVSDARVHVTFTMLVMSMRGPTGRLPQTAPGQYTRVAPVLDMSGRWGVRLDIKPPHAAAFHVHVIDRLGA